MAWATRADLETRFGLQAVADLEAGGASVAAAIADAEAEAAGWIGRAVALPLDPVPDTVVRIVCAIARYNLWQRSLAEDHPAYVAYKDAIKELGGIAAGRIVLPIQGGAAEVATAGAVVVSSVRVFTDSLMAGAAL